MNFKYFSNAVIQNSRSDSETQRLSMTVDANPDANELQQVLQTCLETCVEEDGWEELTTDYWFHPDHFHTWERIRQMCPEITAIMKRVQDPNFQCEHRDLIEDWIRSLCQIATAVLIENDRSIYTEVSIRLAVSDLKRWVEESDAANDDESTDGDEARMELHDCE